ncbi:MAG: YheU family protein [bacterium]|nr:YheU family protein [Myxococcales bacterium]
MASRSDDDGIEYIDDDGIDGVHVPLDQIAPETLRRLVEEFVSREGTDYGHDESDLEAKVAQVMRQLRRGEAAVAYDPRLETATIVPVERRRR